MNQTPLFSTSSTLMDLATHLRLTPELSEVDAESRAVKIRVLANYSTQYLVSALRASLAHRGLSSTIDETPYDQWEFVLNSAAKQDPVDYTLLLLSSSKLILTTRATDPEAFARYLLEAVGAYQAVVGGRVIVAIPESLREGVDQSLVFHTWVRDLRQEMRSSLAGSFFLFDMDALVREFGFERWSPAKHYVTSKLPCHPNCFPAIGSSVADLIWSLERRPTRLVIVDLDNTLWDGEVGEVGWQGVGLDAADSGYPHLLLQRLLLDLKQKGVLLAIASKNEQSNVLHVFENRPEMLLSLDDFSAVEINWIPKSQTIERILQRLNLTPVGITFIDDSRLERIEVRSRVPGIFVPELPDATEEWLRFLVESGMFSAGVVLEEDRNRAAMYRTESERAERAERAESFEDFLRDLQLVVTPERLGPTNLTRAHELVHKTNQFNLTGRRTTATDLAAIATSDQYISYVYRLSDRYGTYGVISAVILERVGIDWVIHTWVMSCRAMGRQVERAVFDHVRCALPRGWTLLKGEYIPTDRNAVLAEFLPGLGFAPEAGSTSMWISSADLPNSVPPIAARIELGDQAHRQSAIQSPTTVSASDE